MRKAFVPLNTLKFIGRTRKQHNMLKLIGQKSYFEAESPDIYKKEQTKQNKANQSELLFFDFRTPAFMHIFFTLCMTFVMVATAKQVILTPTGHRL